MARLYSYPPMAVSVSVPPLEFVQDGANVQVTEDTATPSNNKGLPVLPTFYKDGIPVSVNIDTVTPANNRPLPVELAGTSGTVTINAGDLNVSTVSTNDSMAIGDGVTGNLADVDLNDDAATYSLKVKDDDANAKLSAIQAAAEAIDNSIGADGSASTASMTRIGGSDGTNDQTLLTDTNGRLSIDVNSSALPSGAATAAHQVTQNTALSEIEGAVETIESAIGVDGTPKPASAIIVAGVDSAANVQELRTNTSGELLVALSSSPSGIATETTLSALNNKHSADYGASSGSIRTAAQIGNSTGQADFNDGASSAQTLRVSANLKRQGNDLSYNAGAPDANTLRMALATGHGIATEAKQDTQITLLGDIDTAIDAMSAKLNTLTASYQEDLTVTDASAETITAPAGAKWCKIMADDANTGNMRVKIGGTATTSSGMQFQPGRSEDYQAVGDISYIMETGFTGKIYVQFGA